ncbi:hypothetical protein J6590_008004 [Homalodisca vitripennis]|nr:hypothetical protein J6590_008004 [Homalodisca vitripennis]
MSDEETSYITQRSSATVVDYLYYRSVIHMTASAMGIIRQSEAKAGQRHNRRDATCGIERRGATVTSDIVTAKPLRHAIR